MVQILNFDSLLIRVGNNKNMVNEILHLYIETIPKKLEELKLAVEERNYVLIKNISHALKGASGNISAEKITKTAANLEKSGTEDNIRNSQLLFSILQQEYEELENEIKQLLSKPL